MTEPLGWDPPPRFAQSRADEAPETPAAKQAENVHYGLQRNEVKSAAPDLPLFPAALFAFAVCALPFVALGQRLARAMNPTRGLILGAGTGNDVNVALHNGAKRIVAVEIDP